MTSFLDNEHVRCYEDCRYINIETRMLWMINATNAIPERGLAFLLVILSIAHHACVELADCPAMSFVLVCWQQIEIPNANKLSWRIHWCGIYEILRSDKKAMNNKCNQCTSTCMGLSWLFGTGDITTPDTLSRVI